jgi:hypothetical protein
MEPVTLIIAALVAGATAAMQESAGDAVKSAYAGLKALVKRALGGNPAAGSLVDEHEQDPEVWQKPLEKKLRDADAAADGDLLQAAQALLRLTDPQGAQVGKYNVQVSGGQGVVVGDNATVTQTFQNRQ